MKNKNIQPGPGKQHSYKKERVYSKMKHTRCIFLNIFVQDCG